MPGLLGCCGGSKLTLEVESDVRNRICSLVFKYQLPFWGKTFLYICQDMKYTASALVHAKESLIITLNVVFN